MNLEPFLRSIPLALPGALVSALVFAVCAPRLGRRLSVHPVIAWFYGTALGGFAALTITPVRAALEGYKQGATYFSTDVSLPSLRDLTSANDVSLNIFAGVALGVAGVALARSRGAYLPLVGVILAPVVVELVQWAVPALGRSGFLLTDVAQNWIGLAVGAAVALATTSVTPGRASHAHGPSTSSSPARQ